MTKPKRPLPGQFVEITRRVTQRQFMLRPGRDTRELIGYLYGKAINDQDQTACVAHCNSNHIHSGQTDNAAKRAAFMQQFFSNATRKRNLQLERRENMWAVGAPGDMVLLDLEAIVDKVVYIALQAVEAGCVEHPEEWTGFKILPDDWGKPMRFKRPETCGEDMPEYVEFTPMPPPGFQDLPLEEVKAFFNARIEEARRRILRKRGGLPFLGIEVCEATSPYYTPTTPAPMRTLNPRFSAKNKRLVAVALQKQRSFRAAHRGALTRLRAGDRDVIFPSGTLQMRLRAGVRCGPLDEDDPHLTSTRWTDSLQQQWDDWIARRAG